MRQALSQTNTPLVEPGTQVIEKILTDYIRDELKVTERLGYQISKAQSNTKLALALARLEKMYFLETTQTDLAEKVPARIFRALIFVAFTTNSELFADMIEILKKGVNLDEIGPYEEVSRICDANGDGRLEQYFKTNIHAETRRNGSKKIMRAVLNYGGIRTEALGVSKLKAKDKACEKWLEQYKAKKTN